MSRGLLILLLYALGTCHPSSGEEYCHIEGWDFQKLGYSFSKGHLACEHQRIHQPGWPCPVKTSTRCRRGKNPCSAHVEYAREDSLG